MNNFEKILERVHSFQTSNHKQMCVQHSSLIGKLLWFWVDKEMETPKEGQKVLAVQDLRFMGGGAFVGEYFFESGKFVANLGDSDPYGHIRYWIAADTLNDLSVNPLDYYH